MPFNNILAIVAHCEICGRLMENRFDVCKCYTMKQNEMTRCVYCGKIQTYRFSVCDCYEAVSRLKMIGKDYTPDVKDEDMTKQLTCEDVGCDCVEKAKQNDMVNHPPHYGGENNLYEAIKVIEAWGHGFHISSCLKYLARLGKKDPTKTLEDASKAAWYLNRYIELLKSGNIEKDK